MRPIERARVIVPLLALKADARVTHDAHRVPTRKQDVPEDSAVRGEQRERPLGAEDLPWGKKGWPICC